MIKSVKWLHRYATEIVNVTLSPTQLEKIVAAFFLIEELTKSLSLFQQTVHLHIPLIILFIETLVRLPQKDHNDSAVRIIKSEMLCSLN